VNRQEIFEQISEERDSQDNQWPRTERRKTMYSFSAPHLLLLEEKLKSMRTAWYKGEVEPKEFVKIAAIAVRALEEGSDFVVEPNEDSTQKSSKTCSVTGCGKPLLAGWDVCEDDIPF